MKRLYPRSIKNKFQLSEVLETYLRAIDESPMGVSLAKLSYETRIPESVFTRLMDLQRNPADAVNVELEDFYILFSNICFRYPTVRIWQQGDGTIFIEM